MAPADRDRRGRSGDHRSFVPPRLFPPLPHEPPAASRGRRPPFGLSQGAPLHLLRLAPAPQALQPLRFPANPSPDRPHRRDRQGVDLCDGDPPCDDLLLPRLQLFADRLFPRMGLRDHRPLPLPGAPPRHGGVAPAARLRPEGSHRRRRGRRDDPDPAVEASGVQGARLPLHGVDPDPLRARRARKGEGRGDSDARPLLRGDLPDRGEASRHRHGDTARHPPLPPPRLDRMLRPPRDQPPHDSADLRSSHSRHRHERSRRDPPRLPQGVFPEQWLSRREAALRYRRLRRRPPPPLPSSSSLRSRSASIRRGR